MMYEFLNLDVLERHFAREAKIEFVALQHSIPYWFRESYNHEDWVKYDFWKLMIKK